MCTHTLTQHGYNIYSHSAMLQLMLRNVSYIKLKKLNKTVNVILAVARNVIVGLHSHLLTERQLGTALHEHVSDAQQCLEVGSGKKPSDFVFTYNVSYPLSCVVFCWSNLCNQV